MIRKLYLLLVPLLFASVCHAQPGQTTTATLEAIPSVDQGYIGMIELGYLYGKVHYASQSTDLSAASPTVQLFNGYRLSRGFILGGTVGFDFYDNILVTPLALGVRGEVLDARVSPIYSIDTGYGSTFMSDESENQEFSGGWLFNPAIGMRVRTGDHNSAFSFSVGYKKQRITSSSRWGSTSTEQKINYKRLSLRMGFMF